MRPKKEKLPKSASYGIGHAEDKTALQTFADWMKPIPKNTKIAVTYSEKTIVFIRQDIK